MNELWVLLRTIIASLYTATLLVWLLLTALYLFKLVRGIRRAAPPNEYLFPLWRKDDTFSASAFYVWVTVPGCLFLMSIIPLLDSAATTEMAKNAAFWTAIVGAMVTVLLNYYFGKKLSHGATDSQSAAATVIEKVRTAIGGGVPPPPATGNPADVPGGTM